jgi:hypothetical protein
VDISGSECIVPAGDTAAIIVIVSSALYAPCVNTRVSSTLAIRCEYDDGYAK